MNHLVHAHQDFSKHKESLESFIQLRAKLQGSLNMNFRVVSFLYLYIAHTSYFYEQLKEIYSSVTSAISATSATFAIVYDQKLRSV